MDPHTMDERTTMRKELIILLVLTLSLPLMGESVKQLQKEQKELQKQIAATNKLLTETKNSEKATVGKLELLNKNIKTQKQLVKNLNAEISALDAEITELVGKRDSLQTDLEGLSADYARLIRETHYAEMQQSPLLFLLSSNSFNQLIRRMRYMQEFAAYRKEQVRRIENTQAEIDCQNELLRENRENKASSLKSRKREQENLARDERKQQKMLSELQQKKKDLSAQLKKQQKKADELNKKIDELVKKQAAQDKLTKEQQLVAGDFEKNKGRLPWPMEQGTVTGEFGKHQHPVYKEVTLDNKGLYIQMSAGAKVRAIFDGEVTSCFVMNDSYAVIIQHGTYRSVYSGLATLTIKQGDKVKPKQQIGTVYTDPEQDNKTELYFQIYKGRDIENPRNWLAK